MEWTELIARWFLGGYLLYSGLNGFYQWRPVPRGTDEFENFIAALVKAKFILPTVKLIEIFVGLAFLFNQLVIFSLVLLLPIYFVITGAQFVLNLKKGWPVLLLLWVPYLFMVYYHKVELTLALLGFL